LGRTRMHMNSATEWSQFMHEQWDQQIVVSQAQLLTTAPHTNIRTHAHTHARTHARTHAHIAHDFTHAGRDLFKLIKKKKRL